MKRCEHEVTFRDARVRQLQIRVMECHSVTIKEVQIECAGCMTTMHTRASVRHFKMLKSLKQFQGCKGSFQLNDPVQEGFGSWRTIHRLGFMKGGDQELPLLMKITELGDCLCQQG